MKHQFCPWLTTPSHTWRVHPRRGSGIWTKFNTLFWIFQFVSIQCLVTTMYSIFWFFNFHILVVKLTFYTCLSKFFNFFFSISRTCVKSFLAVLRKIFYHSDHLCFIIRLKSSSSKIVKGYSCIKIQCTVTCLIDSISNLPAVMPVQLTNAHLLAKC